MEKINLTLNGQPVSGEKGITILQLAKENEIDIPTLCYLEGLSPAGSCRMCVVEVKNSRTLVASCHTPISPDMEIQTHSPKVLKARKIIIELLFANHTDNCLMCNKANICELRLIAADLEVGLTRYKGKRHFYPIDDDNPYFSRDLSKCILCRRCIRASRESSGRSVFGIGGRGFDSRVIASPDQEIDEELCEVCLDACPVGALSRKGATTQKKRKTLVIIG
jgi:NADH dehydrogenase/NADH:ubiquinone oxidoreductase subunit G